MNVREEVLGKLPEGEYPDPEAFITDPDALSIYIAGPMTNRPRFNYPAFDMLADVYRAKGYNVISPAEMDDAPTRRAAFASPDGAAGSGALNGETWGDFLARDVKIIADVVDAVVLMPGWEGSTGAKLEAFVARHVGKPVFYATPDGRLPDALYHDDICLCREIGIVSRADFVELDDAELDRVVALSDALTLLKIQQDQLTEEFDRGPLLLTPEEKIYTGSFNAPEVTLTTTIQPPAGSGGDVPDAPPALIPGEVRVTSETGGQKGSKICRIDLIPAEFLHELGLVYGAGAQKYDDDNWRKGYNWRLSLAALHRHLNAWVNGEDFDEEISEIAGQPVSHMANVAWHCATLFTFADEGLGTCDIPERPEFDVRDD